MSRVGIYSFTFTTPRKATRLYVRKPYEAGLSFYTQVLSKTTLTTTEIQVSLQRCIEDIA